MKIIFFVFVLFLILAIAIGIRDPKKPKKPRGKSGEACEEYPQRRRIGRRIAPPDVIWTEADSRRARREHQGTCKRNLCCNYKNTCGQCPSWLGGPPKNMYPKSEEIDY